MGKLMPEVDAFGVDTAAGADKVEVTWALVGSILKPGGGGREDQKRDTPVAMPTGTDARGTPPPNTRDGGRGTGLAPKAEILGRGATAGGWTIGVTGGATLGCTTGVAGIRVAKEFPNESRNSVGLSFGSGGWGGTILMQVVGTFSRVCCMTEAKPWFVK